MPGTLVLMIALCALLFFLAPRRRDVLGATGKRSSLIHPIQAAYAAGRISKAEARHLWKRAILQRFGW